MTTLSLRTISHFYLLIYLKHVFIKSLSFFFFFFFFFWTSSILDRGLPWWFCSKESACNAGDASSVPGLRRSSGEGNDNSTPVFLPGKSHGAELGMPATVHGVTKELDTT